MWIWTFLPIRPPQNLELRLKKQIPISSSATTRPVPPGVTFTTIATVDDSLLAATLGTFNYQLPTPYPLAANTRYWIELDGTSTTSEWSFTATNVGIGVDNEYVYYAGQVFANSAFTPYQMTVTTVVPEPTTVGLCALGLLVIAAVGRVRARLRTSSLRKGDRRHL